MRPGTSPKDRKRPLSKSSSSSDSSSGSSSPDLGGKRVINVTLKRFGI